MAHKFLAASIEEAISHYQFFKRWQPIRYSGMKWLVRLNEESFLIRATKPKTLKEGQELYEINV